MATFEPGKPYPVAGSIDYTKGGIVSRKIRSSRNASVTIFNFDQGQELTEHTSPYEAIVMILDGKATITIGKQKHELSKDQMIILPANIPHAVFAHERFSMLLTMIRS